MAVSHRGQALELVGLDVRHHGGQRERAVRLGVQPELVLPRRDLEPASPGPASPRTQTQHTSLVVLYELVS